MEDFDLSTLPPEVLAQLIEMSGLQDERGDLAQQMQQAEALRFGEDAKGIHTGRTYVAANPLQHLATGIGRVQGQKELEKIRERQQGILEEQIAGRKTYADLLRRKPGATPPYVPGGGTGEGWL